MRSMLLVTALLLAGCSEDGAPREPVSPVLVIVPASRGDSAPFSGESLSLALAAMPGTRLEAVRESTSQVASGVEAARNPFLVDLEDTPMEERRETLQRDLLPSWGAAAAFAASSWQVADGASAVTIAERCPDEARCYSAWDAAADATDHERGARRAAWPITGALILETPSGDAARDLAERLRASSEPIDGIALVMAAGLPAPPADLSAELGELLQSADLLDTAPPAGEPALPAWVADNWVLLVPRLAHLARLASVASGVDRAIAALEVDYTVAWLHRGEGFSPGR